MKTLKDKIDWLLILSREIAQETTKLQYKNEEYDILYSEIQIEIENIKEN